MAEAAIGARGLVKGFGPVVALDGIDLAVPAGGVLGLLGPNGAGKTTAVRTLTTVLAPDPGRASVPGLEVVGLLRKGMGACEPKRTRQLAASEPRTRPRTGA